MYIIYNCISTIRILRLSLCDAGQRDYCVMKLGKVDSELAMKCAGHETIASNWCGSAPVLMSLR